MSQDRNERQPADTRLILASLSPRRAELMREHGYDFDIIAPPFDEPDDFGENLSPTALAQAISHFKAKSVADTFEEGLVLAGDTIAALDDRIFGKPADRQEARDILSTLTGTTHDVITGVTLLDAATGACTIRHASTAVTMKPMSDPQLEAYLDTDAWIGKAGAYGIQDHGDAFVDHIDGSFTNVVGLPMVLVAQMLAEWGTHSV